jgi:NADPH:quinone reductase-like Zn-dependent oxidoreductase
MKAFVLRSYGAPDHLVRTEMDKPVPADDEVLVRVRATSVKPYDWHHMRGEPSIVRLMPGSFGLRAPKFAILGCDMAGQVEAASKNVTEFGPGDDVFALLRDGAFAEYVTVRESLLARKPQALSYEQAAAVPMAAVTALLALRDAGGMKPGQRVLVNGASGGVGTFAVQVARALGGQVAGVCSTGHVDLVRSLGADEVIDYRTEDFTRRRQRYDLLLDIAGSRPATACQRVLTPKGTLVLVGGPAGRWLQPMGHVLGALALAPFMSQRVTLADATVAGQEKHNLTTLAELIEDGRITPVIDRTYPFEELPAAVRYQEEGHASGKVVVTVPAATAER